MSRRINLNNLARNSKLQHGPGAGWGGEMVKDPKEYRWSGYGAALAGDEVVRVGLKSIHPRLSESGWRAVAAEHRKRWYASGGEVSRSGKLVIEREAIKGVLREGGQGGGVAELARYAHSSCLVSSRLHLSIGSAGKR